MSAGRSTTAPTTPDAYSWTEKLRTEHGRSPEDILLEREEMTTRLRLIAALPAALAHATPTQARRVHAYYIAGIKQPEISRIGASSSKVSVAIRRGLRNMRRCYDGSFSNRVRACLCRPSISNNIIHFAKRTFLVEVSDEIVEAFLLDKRAETARERKMFRYKAFYSLDCNDGIENAAIGLGAAIAGGSSG